MSPAHSTLRGSWVWAASKSLGCQGDVRAPPARAVTYLQGCRPSEGLQGLQGLLGLSKDGLWLLGDRLQRKRPGTVNPATAPACGRMGRRDRGCGFLREKGPEAGDTRSLAGREGGARPLTREGSLEAAVRLGAT